MSSLGMESVRSRSSVSIEEDYLIRSILLTHNPDGSQFDSNLLLRTVENIIHQTTTISKVVPDPEIYAINICNAEAIGLQETLGHIIFTTSHEILNRCCEEADLHVKTMLLFEMLGNFKWDAKVVLVLAAFLMGYGEFQLIVQLQSLNPLAALVSLLRQLPSDLSLFRRQFKALTLLVRTMMDLSKVIIEFENLPLKLELLEFKAISVAKSKIYMACYWIFRSSLACFPLITRLRATKPDQVDSDPTTMAPWMLFSLVYRLNGLFYDLREKMETYHQQIGARLYDKLLYLFEPTNIGKQEKLQVLIPLNDDVPFKDCLSKEKHGISELENQIVILLVSKPELLHIEKIFLLVQQTYDHPYQKKVKGSYVILWIPISTSRAWSHADELSFHFLSNSLPFWTLRHPWLLNSAVINFVKQEWNFKEETMMVVMDTHGMITNFNALDMVWIWGAKAFPFSVSREKELWEMESWSLQFLLDNIGPLFTNGIDESESLCLYASNNLEWIKNFSTNMKEIKKTGLHLEVIYAGWRNPSEKVRNILDIIEDENLSTCLSFTEICLFWLRLESMKSSIIRQDHAAGSDVILKEVLGLLEVENDDDGWVVIGTGHDTVKLQGRDLTECFGLFPVWAENVGTLGLLGAIRGALEPPPTGPCHHSDILPYDERLIKGTAICSKCKRPVEKFVIYKCEGT